MVSAEARRKKKSNGGWTKLIAACLLPRLLCLRCAPHAPFLPGVDLRTSRSIRARVLAALLGGE